MQLASTIDSAACGPGGKRIQSCFAQASAAAAKKAATVSSRGPAAADQHDEVQSEAQLTSGATPGFEIALRERDALKEQLKEERDMLAKARSALETCRGELESSRMEGEAARAAMSGMADELKSIRLEQQQEEQRQLKGQEALRDALQEQCFRSRAEAKVPSPPSPHCITVLMRRAVARCIIVAIATRACRPPFC